MPGNYSHDTRSVRGNAFGANRLTVITTTNTYDGVDSSRTRQLGNTGITFLFTSPYFFYYVK